LNSWLKSADMKNAPPKSMPAVTAICPRRLNQPVNQLQAALLLPPSFAAQ